MSNDAGSASTTAPASAPMTVSSASLAHTSSDAAAHAAVGTTSEIGLKVRTLDQKTYQVSVGSDALVSRLKEVVAVETGIALARQRLIFRGKVLKDDQHIATYALEEGHVLHLVARTLDPLPAASASLSADPAASGAPLRLGGSAGATSTVTNSLRNNDEPDPSLGGGGGGGGGGGPPRNRVIIGATTISGPQSGDVSMPLLSSMIANFVNSMGDGATTTTTTNAPSLNMEEVLRRQQYRRPRRRHRDAQARNDPGQATGSQSGQGSQGRSMLGGPALRSLVENYLRRFALANPGYQFPDLPDRELADTADEMRLREQWNQLQAQIEQFAPRMQRLPLALDRIRDLGQRGEEAPNDLVSATADAIETLQTMGDATVSMARYARDMYINNATEMPPSLTDMDGRVSFRASVSIPILNPPPGMPPSTQASNLADTNGSSTGNQHSNSTTASNQDGSTHAGGSGILQTLYERVTAGLRGSAHPPASEAGTQPQSATSSSNTSGPVSAETDAMNRDPVSAVMGTFPPVFPFTVASINTQVPTRRSASSVWEMGNFWQRVVSGVSAANVFGVLRGDATHIHQLMVFVASILIQGIYMPPAARPTVRSWARRFIIEVRSALREQGIPSEILALTPGRDETRFIEEVTRPFDPFMPQLTDYLFRANNASRGDAFGLSCVEFFHTMAQQFTNRMRAYVLNDDAQLFQLFEVILVTLGVQEGLAAYVVQVFLEWASPEVRTRRARDESGDAADAVSAKRQRTS